MIRGPPRSTLVPYRTLVLSSGGHAGDVGAGVGRTFEHQVGRAANRGWRCAAHNNGLDATVDVAALFDGRPGARDDFGAAAKVRHRVAVADAYRAAAVLLRGH